MRLWSLHPRYLDAKGLVALWDAAAWQRVAEVKLPEPHPLFAVVKGEVEDWEVR